MSSSPTLVWFRHALRLEDNPALRAAAARGGPVVPVFVWAPEEEGDWPPGAASRWWLHQSLRGLDAGLRRLGTRLCLLRGPTLTALRQLVAETGADAVYWNRRYEPAAVARDKAVKATLREAGLAAESFNGDLLYEPWEVRTRQGGPFRVYAPFWRACAALPPPARPAAAPAKLRAPRRPPPSLALGELGLEPRIDWAAGMREAWRPGEDGARAVLARFVAEALAGYAAGRERPDRAGNSSLSPYLHFGEVSPRAVWHAAGGRPAAGRAAAGEAFRRELGWREFAYHQLYHFPEITHRPLRPAFAAFPWRDDPAGLRAWRRGRTGYPLVDAGMRQLWRTGWMHNRVRMVTASFLVKHLLLPWQAGARWFWDTLVDADLANNSLNWQWSAGCGVESTPYFRVFNPVSQGEKFDPEGSYVRRWVPELAGLPARHVHRPWEAPAAVLAEAGVTLGVTYPCPAVDHAAGRRRALDAFRSLAGAGGGKKE